MIEKTKFDFEDLERYNERLKEYIGEQIGGKADKNQVVDLTTNQEIGGRKTFKSVVNADFRKLIDTQTNMALNILLSTKVEKTALIDYAKKKDVVDLESDQDIKGNKRFVSELRVDFDSLVDDGDEDTLKQKLTTLQTEVDHVKEGLAEVDGEILVFFDYSGASVEGETLIIS